MPDNKLTEGTTPIDYEGTLKSLIESYYNALDSINRLQAEIERLHSFESYRHCRAKAYKEFAERLKDKHRKIIDYDEAGFGAQIFIVEEKVIDNLLKEMAGDNDG